ncbi:hypothetical protein QCA50_019226 [Cerrena zonata]|uniref:NADP-dependent oxidoreductase domain-containing protein n=1 Tax=Cerrena zonata TaxID=2478898 RepID=A0AAW0FFV7_9APHY
MSAALQMNKDLIDLGKGVKIPAIGLGTYKATAKGEAYNSVKVALKNGYRHIDTAARYRNEEEIGMAIKDSGVPREEIFITTKLWNADHKIVPQALDTSLQKLGVDYVDLYLLHWPISLDPEHEGERYSDWNYIDTYKELQKLMKTGKVRAIGVSNCTKTQLDKLLSDKDVSIKPVVNQIEAHPLLTQPALFDYCKSKDIKIEAYSPLGSCNSPLFKNPTIVELAKSNSVEPAQILVSWAIQRGTVVLPKSSTAARIVSNLKTIKLSDEDFETLNTLSEKDGVVRTFDPDWADFTE